MQAPPGVPASPYLEALLASILVDLMQQHHRSATGILLHPTVKHSFSEAIELQGHVILWQTVDLAQRWEDIESDLLRIP